MPSDRNQGIVQIRLFGALRKTLKGSELPFVMEKEIDQKGMIAYDLALEIGLPAEKIEAVFCNGQIKNIYDRIMPGDRVAFVPYGTPGPYRVFLGMFRENKERKRREQGMANPGGKS